MQYPINLGYLASSLIRAGHEVRMLDFNVIPVAELGNTMAEYNPELVGLTAMTSAIGNAGKIIRQIKAISGAQVVIGGVHASALPVETMESIPELDFLVFGEGEVTLVELAEIVERKSSAEGVAGVVYQDGGRIVKNMPRPLIEDLNTLPFPARHLLPMQLYVSHHVSRGFSRSSLRIMELMTSRGCPNKCIFCAGHHNYGNRLRFRDYENIAAEIEECRAKYGITHISIEDDTFTINRNLVVKLCRFLHERRISWNCNTRVNTVDYELLKLMAWSGCKKVVFGVESGSPEMLIKCKKAITVDDAITAVRDAKRAGIRYVECDFLLGCHPDETLEDINQTIALIHKLRPDFLAVAVMAPYPGTEINRIMREKGLLGENPDWSQFSHYGDLNRYERLVNLTSRQLVDLQRKILKDYYSSPRYILSQALQTRTLSEVKFFAKMAWLFLKEFA